ncbi:MAG TPA: oligoendopeptidase F, partial [Pirellulales bacterium]
MSTTISEPLPRSEVRVEDTWDLTSLFADDDAWKTAFAKWEESIPHFTTFQGTLGRSAARLREFIDFDNEFSRTGDRLYCYASLRNSEDVAATTALEMISRMRNAFSRAGQAAAYFQPEVMEIPTETMAEFIKSPELEKFKITLDRILRYKPHTLSQAEERLLAMQAEMASTAGSVFRVLNDSEMSFPSIRDERGSEMKLSHAGFSRCLHSADRRVRKEAFETYYSAYDLRKGTIAATLNGSIQRDIYYSKVRNHPSALESALFTDNIPVSVYDSLIASVHKYLPAVHHYYDVRKRAMGLNDIHHYDTYVPILSDLQKRIEWDEAVSIVLKSLEPLGSEYVGALEKGFNSRWCDRYENKNKRSGAFSSGMYDSYPYILMNYQPDVLDHVFTLTHEAGHSMHSWYSVRNQPYHLYHYVIFVAEVASTFNEQLLSRYLQENAADDRERAYLINREIDAIRGTLVRQTMFAEFEKITHALAEANEPLTVDRFRSEYRKLLDAYFGPNFVVDAQLELECLRIPHFYNAFYVYKYATGISAAIALSERVVNGGQQELSDYLSFLKGGCSKWPLELLQDA